MQINSDSLPDFVGPECLAAARTGSQATLGQILNAYRDYLLAIARRELPADLQAKAGASDLVQETFFEAQRGFAAFQGQSEEELMAWLRRILLHNLNDFVRHYRDCAKRQVARETPIEERLSVGSKIDELSTQTLTPSGFVMRDEQAAALQRAMSRLHSDYQTVLRLRYWEGKQFEEIGCLMGRSGEAARKVWFRAVKALERELDATHDCTRP